MDRDLDRDLDRLERKLSTPGPETLARTVEGVVKLAVNHCVRTPTVDATVVLSSLLWYYFEGLYLIIFVLVSSVSINVEFVEGSRWYTCQNDAIKSYLTVQAFA